MADRETLRVRQRFLELSGEFVDSRRETSSFRFTTKTRRFIQVSAPFVLRTYFSTLHVKKSARRVRASRVRATGSGVALAGLDGHRRHHRHDRASGRARPPAAPRTRDLIDRMAIEFGEKRRCARASKLVAQPALRRNDARTAFAVLVRQTRRTTP